MSAALKRELTALDAIGASMRRAIDRLLARDIKRGVANYRRERALPLLIGPHWRRMSDEAIRVFLANRIRVERHRLRTGHWCADPNRMLCLKIALAAEEERK